MCRAEPRQRKRVIRSARTQWGSGGSAAARQDRPSLHKFNEPVVHLAGPFIFELGGLRRDARLSALTNVSSAIHSLLAIDSCRVEF